MTEEKKEGKEGLGKIGLGGIFKGIENLVDLAVKLKESGKTGEEIQTEGKLNLDQLRENLTRFKEDMGRFKGNRKAVFGLSVKRTPAGRPKIGPFCNIRKTPQGLTIEEEREPITDVFDEEDEMKVYAEMPGINKENINIELKEDILDISAQNGKIKFRKEILLPTKGNVDTLTSNYKNGILEVKVKKNQS